MRRNFFEVVNVGKSSNVGKLKIYGVIGDWWEGNTANSFTRAFQDLEAKYDEIHIHINSPGGSVHEGLAIANAIKSSSKDVHTFVDGIAYSMAAIITVAAKKGNAHMAKGSLLMLHNASSFKYGNAAELREEADVLDKYDDTLVSFVADRTGQSLADARKNYFNHKDNFFTSDEAKTEGLIDTIESYEAEGTPDNVRNMNIKEVAAWYMNTEEEPSASFMSRILAKVKDAINPENNSDDMFNKYSKLSALAKVAVKDITAEQLEEVNNQIAESGVEGVTVVTDSYLEKVDNYDDVAAENATLKTDKTNLQTKVTNLEIKVTDLKKSGTDKDNRIAELEEEVKALGGKPAGSSGSPESRNGDQLPDGDGGAGETDEFSSPIENWARKHVS